MAAKLKGHLSGIIGKIIGLVLLVVAVVSVFMIDDAGRKHGRVLSTRKRSIRSTPKSLIHAVSVG